MAMSAPRGVASKERREENLTAPVYTVYTDDNDNPHAPCSVCQAGADTVRTHAVLYALTPGFPPNLGGYVARQMNPNHSHPPAFTF